MEDISRPLRRDLADLVRGKLQDYTRHVFQARVVQLLAFVARRQQHSQPAGEPRDDGCHSR